MKPLKRSGQPKINVGLIGTGVIAQEHARAIRVLSQEFVLTTAFDADPKKLEKFLEPNPGIVSAKTLNEMLSSPSIDLVVVATPPSTHEALVVSALQAGKYALCEKPLSNSMSGALRIIEAAQKFPGHLAVDYQMRYDLSFRRLKWICENNQIGEIQSARIQRHSYIPHTNVGAGGWWGSWNIAGGGVLVTQLIHEIDLLTLLMGKPLAVRGKINTRYMQIESEDMVDATLFFDRGKTATISASVNSGFISGEFKICGDAGNVSLPWSLNLREGLSCADAIKALDKALPDTRQPAASLLSRGAHFLRRRLGMPELIEFSPHVNFYAEIANCIHAGQALPISASEAMTSLEVCMSIYESALSGTEIKLPLSTDCRVFNGMSKVLYDRRPNSINGLPSQRNKAELNTRSLKIGLLGLDTSHAPTFAKILHDPYYPGHIPGARIVAAWPGGSSDMKISASRVKGFTDELRGTYDVPILQSPQDVAEQSDLIFILSADGRTHPGLLRAVVPFGKPVFIDKPFALSTKDARDMFGLAAANKVKLFASSAFRYADGLVNVLETLRLSAERIESCEIHCWLPIEPTQGRYFWYGIHASEMLLAIMGTGIQDVLAKGTDSEDKICARHRDGRKSCIYGSRNNRDFKVKIITARGEININLAPSADTLSARLLQSALDVLTTGQFPRLWQATESGSVSGFRPGRLLDPTQDQTIDVVRLLEASQESFASGGYVVV